MMLFEKLFRTEPTEKDQWQFLASLGALEEDFLFVERTSDFVLRVCRVQNGRRDLFLDLGEELSLPVVTLDHGKTISSAQTPSSFFVRKILPYPWSEFLISDQPNEKIGFSDVSFAQKCGLFSQGLLDLEGSCLRAEVTCLSWGNPLEELAYVFHGVRNKILRVGLSDPKTLGLLQPELKKVRFEVLRLGRDNPMNFKGFELATHRLKTLEGSDQNSTRTSIRPYDDDPIPFEL